MPLSTFPRGSRILVALLLLTPHFAFAQNATEADLKAATRRAEALRDQGKTDEAIEAYRQAVNLARDVYGKAGDLRTMPLLDDLAELYKAKGDFTRAEALCKRALQVREEQLGADNADVGFSLLRLGRVYHTAKRFEDAESVLRQSLAIYEKANGKTSLDVAHALSNLGATFIDANKHSQAEPLLRRCLAIYEARQGKNGADVGNVAYNLALCAEHGKNWGAAAAYYQRALPLLEAKHGKQSLDAGHTLFNLARAQHNLARYKQADANYRKALPIYEEKLGRDSLNVADTLFNIGLVAHGLEKYTEADGYFQRALPIYEARFGPQSNDFAKTVYNLGFNAHTLGVYDQAKSFYERSLAIYEQNEGRNGLTVAEVLVSLARVHVGLALYDQAETLARRSLVIRQVRLGKDSVQAAHSLETLASIHSTETHYDLAEPELRKCLEIYESRLGRDASDVGWVCNELADILSATGQYGQAREYHQRCIDILEKKLGKDHKDLTFALTGLAWVELSERNYDRSLELLKRVLQIRETKLGKDHTFVADTLYRLGWVNYSAKRFTDAEKFFRRSLELRESILAENHPDVAQSVNGLGALYWSMGEYDKAEPFYDRGLKIFKERYGADHPDVGVLLFNKTFLHASQGRWRDAADRAEDARRITRGYVARTLSALSDQDQLTFLRNKDEANLHTGLTLGLVKKDDARIAEMSAGWLLNGKAVAEQALAERALLVRDGGNSEVRQKLLEVRKQLASLGLKTPTGNEEASHRQTLARLAKEEADLTKELSRTAETGDRANPWVEVSEVRKAIPGDAVLIDIACFWVHDFSVRQSANSVATNQREQHYVAWIIPPAGKGRVQIVDLGRASTIDAAVQAVRKSFEEAPTVLRKGGEAKAEAELKPRLEALAKLVLWPLVRETGKTTRWVLSPDALLWLVPWGALPLRDGSYAIETYHISYAVSGRDVLPAQEKAKPGPALVLADPDYDLGRKAGEPTEDGAIPRVKRLAGTAQEAKAVKPLLTRYLGSEPQVLLAAEATERAFKDAKAPEVLLVSTHGFFFADKGTGAKLENPLLRCGVLLAGANRRGASLNAADEDGVLYGLEIVGTDLRGTDLVVLSACETGLGLVRNGEGVAGLRQAFQLAGAKTVVGSLWSVPDADTAALMSVFFQKLADGEGKAEALRLAQLARIKAHREKKDAAHPFFWAAFTLTGQQK